MTALRPLAGVPAAILVDLDYRAELDGAKTLLLALARATQDAAWRKRDMVDKALKFTHDLRELVGLFHDEGCAFTVAMAVTGAFETTLRRKDAGSSRPTPANSNLCAAEIAAGHATARRALRIAALHAAALAEVFAALRPSLVGEDTPDLLTALERLLDRVTPIERMRALRRLGPARLRHDGKLTTRGYRLTLERDALLRQVDGLARQRRYGDVLALLKAQTSAAAIGRKRSWARHDHASMIVAADFLATRRPAWNDDFHAWQTIIHTRGFA